MAPGATPGKRAGSSSKWRTVAAVPQHRSSTTAKGCGYRKPSTVVSSSVQLLIDFEWFKIPDKIAKLLNTIKDHSIESLFEKVFSAEQ